MWPWRLILSSHQKRTLKKHLSWTTKVWTLEPYAVCRKTVVLTLMPNSKISFFWTVTEVDSNEYANVASCISQTNESKVVQVRGLPWTVDKAYIMKLFPCKKWITFKTNNFSIKIFYFLLVIQLWKFPRITFRSKSMKITGALGMHLSSSTPSMNMMQHLKPTLQPSTSKLLETH